MHSCIHPHAFVPFFLIGAELTNVIPSLPHSHGTTRVRRGGGWFLWQHPGSQARAVPHRSRSGQGQRHRHVSMTVDKAEGIHLSHPHSQKPPTPTPPSPWWLKNFVSRHISVGISLHIRVPVFVCVYTISLSFVIAF